MNSPAVYAGNVVEPSHISQPHSYSAHDFFNTIRDMLHMVPFHNEQDRLSALDTVSGYEKHVVGNDAAYVVGDQDRAATEDVRLRVPPTAGLPALAPAAQIDYARLAAAIVAAQSQAAAQPQPPAPQQDVSTITDAEPSRAPAQPAAPYPQVRVPGA